MKVQLWKVEPCDNMIIFFLIIVIIIIFLFVCLGLFFFKIIA